VPTNPPGNGCQAITSTVNSVKVGEQVTFDVSSSQSLVCVHLDSVSGVSGLNFQSASRDNSGKWHWKWVGTATTNGSYAAQFKGNTVGSGNGSCDARAIGQWCQQVVNYRIDPVATDTLVPVCKECSSDFGCYRLNVTTNNSVEYRWFVQGYTMGGFAKVDDGLCNSAGVAKPTFKGKKMGDANCDGRIDVTDYAVWRREFVDLSEGVSRVSTTWEADFTGPDGKCDGIVNVYDYSLWHKYFSELMISGGN